MAQLFDIKFTRGLDLNSNPLYGDYTQGDLYGGPRCALTIADECVLTRNHMIGNRRGFQYFSQSTPAPVDAMFEYQSNIVQHQTDNTLWYGDNTSGNRTQYTGTYIPPSPYRMDATVGRGSLFFTATSGTQKLDAITAEPLRAGMTKGLDVRCYTTGTGNGFMNGLSSAGYQVTWTRTDANGQVLTSDVSTEIVVTNSSRVSVTSLTLSGSTATATTATAHGFSTGNDILISGATQTQYNGTYAITVTSSTTFTYSVSGSPTSPATGTITAEIYLNVNVEFTVPADVQSGDSWQVWRTVTASAAGGASPGDTCYLVTTTANTNAAGSTITFLDSNPDSTVSANTALYTNATQQGATSGNSRPPVCSTVTTYYDYTIYANSAIDHQLTIEMLATTNFVAGTSSITLTPTTGSARTYTFNTVENVATQTAQIYTGGISAALNIQETTQSLCHVINGDTSGSWYAEYTSSWTGNPGFFRIWSRSPLSGEFYVTVNNSTTGNQFSPTLPTTGQTVYSSNDYRANRLYYSKFQQPDHVPVLQYEDIGRLDMPIRRVLALRDGIYVLKDDGVWYMQGLVAPFAVSQLDSTTQIIGPATAVVLNNSIFCLSNQGVVQISTSGVTTWSFPIEPVIQDTAMILPNLSTVAFGVGNEVDRQYVLWLPTLGGDTYGTQAYVYHTVLQEWTHWLKPAMCAITLQSNNLFYISSGIENAILQQRKTNSTADYSDETLAITVTGQSGLVVTATWANTNFTPTVGVSLAQGAAFAKVTAVQFVSGTTWQFTIDRTSTFSNGAATASIPIYAHVRLSPQTGGEVGVVKQFYASVFVLDSSSNVSTAWIECGTNEASTLYAFSITRTLSSGWGEDSWGNVAWGDVTSPIQSQPWNVDVPIPDNTGETITAGWYHAVSTEQFIIAQIAFSFDMLGEYEDAPD